MKATDLFIVAALVLAAAGRWLLWYVCLPVLVVLTLLVSSGCANRQVMPDPPARPVLEVVNDNPGLVCFPVSDAGKLATYIVELEAGYGAR